MARAKKLHWYVFSFFGQVSDGRNANTCTFVGFEDKNKITVARIDEQRKQCDLVSSTLMAVSYLGHMTIEECENN